MDGTSGVGRDGSSGSAVGVGELHAATNIANNKETMKEKWNFTGGEKPPGLTD